jgi:hypothetical protein
MADAASDCNLGGDHLTYGFITETKALLKYDRIDFMMTDRATARIEGDADDSTMVLEGKVVLTSEN